jgi:hypothetical protein
MMVKNASPRQAQLLGHRPALFEVQMQTAPSPGPFQYLKSSD